MGDATAAGVVAFWRDAGLDKWFGGGADFDAECRERFEAIHHAAARGEYAHWQTDAEGALALQILLDQMPRNLYRGSGHAFATDGLALSCARDALARGLDLRVDESLRVFIYLAFEHAEAMAEQDIAVAKIAALGDATYTQYAEAHRDVIARFGRFPHRNAALGRIDTPEETAYLAAGGGF